MFDWWVIRWAKVPIRVKWTLFGMFLGIALGGSLVWSSPKYHSAVCPNNENYRQGCTAEDTENDDPSVFVAIGAWATQHREAVEALAALGTALFTIVLAFSTIGLWLQTKRLAEG